MAYWHLAELNLAQAAPGADLDAFYALVPGVNALAEASPGFVWRDTSDAGPDAEPGLLVNLSVWESLEALRAFTYQGRHLEVFRDKARWFARPAQPMMVLWWTPAGHRPSLEEARERLAWLRQNGPSPVAFSFAQNEAKPPEPPPASPGAAPLDLDGRVFASLANTDNGDVGAGSRFSYRQQGRRIWSVYQTPKVRFGTLVARLDEAGEIDMRYQQLSASGVRRGRCQSRIESLPDGRLRLHERWQWLDGDQSTGESVLEEVVA